MARLLVRMGATAMAVLGLIRLLLFTAPQLLERTLRANERPARPSCRLFSLALCAVTGVTTALIAYRNARLFGSYMRRTRHSPGVACRLGDERS